MLYNDGEIEVRAKAFQLLQNVESGKVELIVNKGIPLNIDDKVYCVYQSSLSYGDDWYYLDNEIDEYYDSDYPFYKGYSIYITDLQEDNELDEYYNPKLMFIFLDEARAKKAANLLHSERLLKLDDCEFGMIYTEKEQIDLDAWCAENKVSLIRRNHEEDYEFEDRIFRSLQKDKDIQLLNKLWDATVVGKLSFIHERIIDRKCYFKPTKYF